MNSKAKLLSFLILFLAMQLLNSCMQETIVDISHDVGDGWTKDQKLAFDYEIRDSITPIDFYINIRNSTEYEYANIFFFIKTIYPNQRYSIDTVECFLANMKGDWLGKGLGKFRNSSIAFKKNMRFPMKGHYHMEFEMAMRDTILDGIDALGIRVEKTPE